MKVEFVKPTRAKKILSNLGLMGFEAQMKEHGQTLTYDRPRIHKALTKNHRETIKKNVLYF